MIEGAYGFVFFCRLALLTPGLESLIDSLGPGGGVAACAHRSDQADTRTSAAAETRLRMQPDAKRSRGRISLQFAICREIFRNCRERRARGLNAGPRFAEITTGSSRNQRIITAAEERG